MMLNGMFAWNMSVVSEPLFGCLKLKKWQFHAVVATEMMNFVDNGNHADSGEEDPDNEDDVECRAHLLNLVKTGQQLYCQVCKLEGK